jgi:hypothetical protein
MNNNGLGDLSSLFNNLEPIQSKSTRPKSQTFSKKLENARRKSIENDNLENDQRLKKISLIILFVFLSIETVAIFVLAFFQGFGDGENGWFYLDAWSFRLVMAGTLGQITAMLTIAIKHLFPKKN